jgi:hypothetical protein
MRSARVDFPWSMWAMMLKFLMFEAGFDKLPVASASCQLPVAGARARCPVPS